MAHVRERGPQSPGPHAGPAHVSGRPPPRPGLQREPVSEPDREKWRSRALPPPQVSKPFSDRGHRRPFPWQGDNRPQARGRRRLGLALPSRKGARRCPAQRRLLAGSARHSGGPDAGLGAFLGGGGLRIGAGLVETRSRGRAFAFTGPWPWRASSPSLRIGAGTPEAPGPPSSSGRFPASSALLPPAVALEVRSRRRRL
ncbi:NELL2-interacting cell ontogeny regulator 1 isoform X1 [Vicugna pacos]|uniref:NELL2-interacting cell ontogeny regulator 1 isoform X1 n=1 Tax=Vicugna pacos TaxID=30538 RepID=A0ABM5C668_VICPA